MDATEITRRMNQLYLALRHVNDLKYQIERAKYATKIKETAFKEANDVYKKQAIVKRELTTVVNNLEHEASCVAETIKLRREQLDSANSNRVYETLKLQIKMDEVKNDRLADETLTALAKLEEADSLLCKLSRDVQACDNSLGLAKSHFEKLRKDSEIIFLKTKENVIEIVRNLPREYVGIYLRLAKGNDEPIAPVVDKDYCGSCNQSVPPNVVLEIRSGVASCCCSCGKLLFILESSDS